MRFLHGLPTRDRARSPVIFLFISFRPHVLTRVFRLRSKRGSAALLRTRTHRPRYVPGSVRLHFAETPGASNASEMKKKRKRKKHMSIMREIYRDARDRFGHKIMQNAPANLKNSFRAANRGNCKIRSMFRLYLLASIISWYYLLIYFYLLASKYLLH